MMKKKGGLLFVLSLVVAACATQYPPTEVHGTSVLAADTLQRGQAAYDRQDYLTAFKEWLPLARQGIALAQHNLGVLYAEGRGVPKNGTEAVRWYRQAATQGFAPAQLNLGVLYEQGRGIAKDDAEAVRWYRQAAQQGNAQAQHNLAVMYEQGQGVSRDLVEAQRWYAKAAELFPPGSKRIAAIEARDRVIQQLIPTQLPVAQPASVTPPPPLFASPLSPAPRPALANGEAIPLVKVGGVYALPVAINGVLTNSGPGGLIINGRF